MMEVLFALALSDVGNLFTDNRSGVHRHVKTIHYFSGVITSTGPGDC